MIAGRKWRDDYARLWFYRVGYWLSLLTLVSEIVVMGSIGIGHTTFPEKYHTAALVFTVVLALMAFDVVRRMGPKIRALRTKLAMQDMLRH